MCLVNVEKRQIFVVEDDEAVRASTKTLLEAQGYLVRDFADAEAFLLVSDGRDADCIVLDHQLSGMSGLDLIAKLRGSGITTPAIVISSEARPILERALKENVHAVLHKPLAADALLRWLAQIFAEAR